MVGSAGRFDGLALSNRCGLPGRTVRGGPDPGPGPFLSHSAMLLFPPLRSFEIAGASDGLGKSAADSAAAGHFTAAEQGDQLPERGYADERVDDPAEQAQFAEQGRDQVEAEQAEQAPVEAADACAPGS